VTSPVRLAIFDLDGTLVDSRLDLCRSVNHALRAVGLPARSLEEVSGFVGDGAATLIRRALGSRQDLFEPALASWREHYQAHLLDHTVLFPGILPFLQLAPFPLAVHTNKPGAMARAILAGLGVGARFAAVVGGDEAARKPDPGGTRAILGELRVAPAEAVLVGDSLVDLETARAVPMRFLAVGWGFASPEQLGAAGASSVARTVVELAEGLGLPGDGLEGAAG